MGEGDPSAVRSLAVFDEDVVDAFVYTRENPGTAVLRVTPPFHGRMRGRLHVYHVDDTTATGAIHVDPADLLDSSVVDDYPAFAAVETRTGVDSPTEGQKAYADAVDRWRTRARESIVGSITLETDGERHSIDVKRLEREDTRSDG